MALKINKKEKLNLTTFKKEIKKDLFIPGLIHQDH